MLWLMTRTESFLAAKCTDDIAFHAIKLPTLAVDVVDVLQVPVLWSSGSPGGITLLEAQTIDRMDSQWLLSCQLRLGIHQFAGLSSATTVIVSVNSSQSFVKPFTVQLNARVPAVNV